jgi:hypothetical protein
MRIDRKHVLVLCRPPPLQPGVVVKTQSLWGLLKPLRHRRSPRRASEEMDGLFLAAVAIALDRLL